MEQWSEMAKQKNWIALAWEDFNMNHSKEDEDFDEKSAAMVNTTSKLIEIIGVRVE